MARTLEVLESNYLALGCDVLGFDPLITKIHPYATAILFAKEEFWKNYGIINIKLSNSPGPYKVKLIFRYKKDITFFMLKFGDYFNV